MTQDERDVVMERLTLLAEVLSEPMTDTRLAGYCLTLDDEPVSDLLQAINASAKLSKFFPKPAELIELARQVQHRRDVAMSDEQKRIIDERIAARREAELPPAPEPKALPPAEPVLTTEERLANQQRFRELMAEARKKLRSMPTEESKGRQWRPYEERIDRDVRLMLPEFVKACEEEATEVVMATSAFGDHETDLLGKAIKFAGKHGKTVHVVVESHEQEDRR